MRKVFAIVTFMFVCSMNAVFAQNVTVEEPEFAEETLLLTSDSEGTKLARENGSIKTKAGASIYIIGIGKVKSRLTLKEKNLPAK